MADAYTTTASLTFDQTAYDRMVYFALRPELFFDRVATVGPTRQSMPGAAVVFNFANELAAATTPLAEAVDVDAVAIGNTQKTITLAEYGSAVITTARIRAFSFVELDPIVANLVGYNAGVSQDTLARDALVLGTNVSYGTLAGLAGRTNIGAANNLNAAQVRRMLARLRGANVPTIGGNYVAYIHPDISYDLRSETGGAGWRDPHTYSQPSEIWNGEVGTFENFRFIESPRAPQWVDASNGAGAGGTVDVYGTLFLGAQALAKAFATVDGNGAGPRVVLGPVVDKLRRFVPIGWYWLGAYGVFREAALWRSENASSIGTN